MRTSARTRQGQGKGKGKGHTVDDIVTFAMIAQRALLAEVVAAAVAVRGEVNLALRRHHGDVMNGLKTHTNQTTKQPNKEQTKQPRKEQSKQQ